VYHLNQNLKLTVALASGATLLLGALCPTIQAQSVLIESGSSVLADTLGTATGPEAVTVSWFVLENTATDIFTYGYNVNNPTGDVQLPGAPDPGQPETVGSLTLSFDTTVQGALVSATAPVGGTFQNNDANGLSWTFPSVNPGNVSALLAFQSTLAPVLGNASAGDGAIPPAPWSSVPNGQPVPVPGLLHATPEPETTTLLALTLLFLPFRSTQRRFSSEN
jgi:hypothetical protein